MNSTKGRNSSPGSGDNNGSPAGAGPWLFALGGFGGFLAATFVGVIVATWAVTGMDDATATTRGTVSLAEGERVYASRCAQCHGPVGEGGSGPALGGGAVTEIYPDIADQIAVIANGRGAMPTFGNALTDAEIESVARYERETLGS